MKMNVLSPVVSCLCVLAMAVLTGCGDDNSADGDECEVPSGTYEMEIVDAGGNCDSEFVDRMAGVRDMDVEEGEQCGSYSELYTESFTAEGYSCSQTLEIEATATADGIEGGTIEAEAECNGQVVCEHGFNAYFEKR